MPLRARFGHVNLIARDWRGLAGFYQQVFGCEPVPPERDYTGPELAAGTGVPGARLRGVHLRLPGMGPEGPTLEIYAYDPPQPGGLSRVDEPGFRHIAFAVEDVEHAREVLRSAGGKAIGEVVESVTSSGERVTWCYCRDPEGNIIELQRWG